MTLEDAVDLAIANVATDGLTDIFGYDHEAALLRAPEMNSRIRSALLGTLKTWDINQLSIQPLQHVLVPKNRTAYDYRRAALLSPLCTLTLLSLAIYVAPAIEAKKIPLERRTIFSYRFAPKDGKLFREDCGYSHWMDEYMRRRDEAACKVVVRCDLASFYDRANLHRLESTLLDIGVEPRAARLIDGLLKIWSRNDSYGLPIGSNGSRILAEAVLLEIDRHLEDNGVSFIRYVDDYRMFAPDLPTAQRWLALLTTRLFRDGLMLNALKTRVDDKAALLAKADDSSTPQPGASAGSVMATVTVLNPYTAMPRRFKMPKPELLDAYRSEDVDALVAHVLANEVVDFEHSRRAIIAALVQRKLHAIRVVPEMLKRCIPAPDYIVDMLEKNSEDIPAEVRSDVRNQLAQLLDTGLFDELDWHKALVLRLLGTPAYLSKKALMNAVLHPQRVNSSYPATVALETLEAHATRTDVTALRDRYERSGEWERRRIMRLVSKYLPEEERKAWFRSIRYSVESDAFTKETYGLLKEGFRDPRLATPSPETAPGGSDEDVA